MLNMVENTLALVVLFILTLVMSIAYYVFDPMIETTGETLENNGGNNIISSSWMNLYYSSKNLILSSFYVLVSLMVLIALTTSTFDSSSYLEYFIKIIISIFLVPIAVYFTSILLSTFSEINFAMDDLQMTFINNWNLIFIANFFAGMLSFIFVKRGDATYEKY